MSRNEHPYVSLRGRRRRASAFTAALGIGLLMACFMPAPGGDVAWALDSPQGVGSVTSPTHPDENAWYRDRNISFSWTGTPVSALAARIGDGAWASCIKVVGNRAYLGFEGGLSIVDVTDPAHPSLLGSYTGGWVKAVDVEGSYAYCVVGGSTNTHVVVLDVSNPQSPTVAASVAPPVLFQTDLDGAILVKGGYVYVPFQDFYNPFTIYHYLGVLDVRNLSDPHWVTTDQCPIHDSVNKLALSGSLLYVAESSHLGVVSIANPAAPVLLASYTANCGGLAVGGGMLYSGNTVDLGQVYAFGLSNPAAPAFLGDLACAHSYLLGADEVALYEPSAGQRYLLTAYDASPAEFEWVEMLDVTPPLRYGDQSLLLYQGDLAGVENDWIFDMAVAGDWVYLAYENHGVTISHLGFPSGYSYSLDANPGTLPDTTAESAGGPAGSVTLTAPSDGTLYFHVRAGDLGGAWGATAKTFAVHVDTAAPTTTAALSPTANAAGWNKTTPVTVTLTASDTGGSGLAHTFYSVDGGGQQTYGGSFGVPGQASHTITYWSTDKAGNSETTKTVAVKTDSQAPTTIAYAATVKRNKKVSLCYKVKDSVPGSGKASVTLKIFRGAKLKRTIGAGVCATNVRTSYHWRCTLAKGAYTIKVFATDQAGNAQVKVGSAKLTVK
jgi:hypothetical protein